MNDLTKYQISKIMELMCPACNGDLNKVSSGHFRCQKCENHYVTEAEYA